MLKSASNSRKIYVDYWCTLCCLSGVQCEALLLRIPKFGDTSSDVSRFTSPESRFHLIWLPCFQRTLFRWPRKKNKLNSSTQLEHLWITIANMRHTLRCNKWHLDVDGKQLLSNPIKVHSTWRKSSLELEIQSASQGTKVMNITKVSTITTFLEQYKYYYILKFVSMCTDTCSYHTTPHQKVFSRQLMESI